MTIKSIAFLLFFLCTVAANGQRHSQLTTASKQPTFSSESERISTQSQGSLSLVNLGSAGSPQLLVAKPSQTAAILYSEERSNPVVVSNAVYSYMKRTGMAALGLPSSAELRDKSTLRVRNLWNTSYEVAYNGIRVRDLRIHVHTGALSGKVTLIRNNVPSALPNSDVASISTTNALRLATSEYRAVYVQSPSDTTEQPNLIYVAKPDPSNLRLAYETTLSDGFHLLRYTIDAITGTLLEKRDMIDCNFNSDPSPIAKFQDESSSEELTSESVESAPTGALENLTGRVTALVHFKTPTDKPTLVGMPYQTVTVNKRILTTDSAGYWSMNTVYPVTISCKLSGPYEIVKRADSASRNASLTATITAGALDVLWSDTNSTAPERDVFYSVALARAYAVAVDPELTTDGTDGINERLTVYVNEAKTCNAFYNPQDRSLNFFHAGGGCANTAQIADVVEHEFGHRVNHIRYEQGGANDMVDASLNEGFADLFSNFLRDNSTIGLGFNGGSSTLRNSNNAKIWPKDISPDGHITGQLIAGAIWDLRKLLGRDTAAELFALCGRQIPDGNNFNDPGSIRTTFLEVLTAILITDDDDNDLTNGTPHSAKILRAFQTHNLGIQNFFDMDLRPVSDQPAGATAYPVSAFVGYHGIVGAMDPESVVIHYSTDNKTYSTTQLHRAADSLFTGSIPAVARGAMVRYYLTAGTSFDSAGVATYPMYKTQPFAFLVGYESKYSDECEQDNGWELTNNADTNYTGSWVQSSPSGTFATSGIFVQQDTDHSTRGNQCYITGNSNAGSSFPSVISDDPVTNGNVTLQSNAVDLTSYNDPYVRYWYYFSNDASDNALAPVWKTFVSTDAGKTWKALQATVLPTKGWTPYVFRMKDIASKLSATTMLRFVASDYVAAQTYPEQLPQTGTVVEAGVDDLEILDLPAAGVQSGLAAQTASVTIFPNPAERGTHVSIEIDGPQQIVSPIHYDLRNTIGETVASGLIHPVGQSWSLQIPQELSAGVYYCSLEVNEQMIVRKITVQ